MRNTRRQSARPDPKSFRSAEGNLRLCRNLCYASLIEAARETKKVVTITHVNNILVQPHWRSHEELIKQQVAS